MYSVGDKIVYGENGVCTVWQIGPIASGGADKSKLYYHLVPFVGSGTYFAPVDSEVFMRPVISREEAEALIAAIPGIEPAICNDSRFNHVDAFYKELFKLHTCEALVSIVKGLRARIAGKKTRSSRAESTMRRARDMLHSELAVALGIDIDDVEQYITDRTGKPSVL